MLRVPSITRNTSCAILGALLLVLSSAPAWAVPAIDMRLNVSYTNGNPLAGGNWDLVTKTDIDTHGISALRVLLTNINFASAQSTAPRGFVNGNDPAGLSVFVKSFNSGLGFTDITLGQLPIVPAAVNPEEQSVFYGIGKFANGAPNYPGKPPTAAFEGPVFTSLTNVVNVPWATSIGDGDWDRAARLATGSFPAGVTPGFYANGGDVSRGNLFLTVGTSANYGNISDDPIIAMTFVKTNSLNNGDYNHNGVVDAADYVVWRDTLGLTSPLDADGNNNGVIDGPDYLVWRQNFGMTFPGAGAALGLVAAVPEPCGALLIALGGALALHRFRRNEAAKIRARRNWGTSRGHQAKFFTSSCPISSQSDASAASGHTDFGPFSGRFSQLLNSSEKRSFERRNCLTAPKTANIMPEGSVTEGALTIWGHSSGRCDCASGRGVWELSSGAVRGRNESQTDNSSPSPVSTIVSLETVRRVDARGEC